MKLSFDLERKLRKYSIRNLMNYIIAGMAIVYAFQYIVPSYNFIGWLTLSRSQVFSGQIWRLITFVIVPPSTSPLWLIFSLYFYWLIGSMLENYWGTARFNLYYLVGIVGCILSALITGYSENSYLNMSLFLAFAAINPNFEVRVFYILPIKIKYLALLDVVFYLIMFIFGTWSIRVTILLSLVNVLLFFGGDLLNTIRRKSGYWKTRYNFRRSMRK